MYGPALQAGKLVSALQGLRVSLCLVSSGWKDHSDLDLWVNQWANAIDLALWLQQQVPLDFGIPSDF